MNWQPISTYDGTYAVLLRLASGARVIGGRDVYGWYICGDGTEYHEIETPPTHWAHIRWPDNDEELAG